MRLKAIADSSIVISSLRNFYKWYTNIDRRVSYIYHNSQIARVLNIFWEKTKICFKYSFLGRVSEIEQTRPAILDNSWVIQCLTNFYKRLKDKFVNYFSSSLTIALIKDIKEELNSVRVISIITVIALSVNLVSSIILQRQIGIWGWLIRALFLFIAVSGLFCPADWTAVEKNSIFLRKMQRKNEKDLYYSK